MRQHGDRQNRTVRFAWVARSLALVIAFALSTACSGSNGSGYSEGEDISGPGPALHGPYCGTLETSGTATFPDAQKLVIGVKDGPLDDGDCGPVLQFFREYLAAGGPIGNHNEGRFNGVVVETANDYDGQLAGYEVWARQNNPTARNTYGSMRGFAIAE